MRSYKSSEAQWTLDPMKKPIFLCALPCLLCSPLPRVFGWGAVTGFNTHGLINTAAYAVLARDSAYDAKGFCVGGTLYRGCVGNLSCHGDAI